ncbi:bifunctional oligoribonuclease/PAP phosphatase NrnA [Flavobacteriaceae bacterium TP-CH-4]|uniref:Bifunctional oligoribonuclease/PAP phosphatase NrnA n=1 Tax=Pelagihabitans pacificus TaxID=2696054 RepID=A0A967AVI6_9FLAO|nr:bifunctional oligoribonuclease/PAP phosphatase NrnA [Pelagihabitans pacificus]NHF61161.1 bifunctional oligoribonuclease/PAP phosphatase NrnA [Pelagihabitans pacificus]
MNFEDINAVKKLLSESRNIVIVPHKNPDGDAIGSTLGLWFYLKSKGHNASVIVPNDFPKFLKWMPGNDHILIFEKHNTQSKDRLKQADLIFTLDFNHLGRAGQMEELLATSEVPFIMIDHHQKPDDYAEIIYSDVEMSSTCEMVYNFIEYLGGKEEITPEIADCLYTGIMTDTGSFKYSSTTSRTHRIVADLIDRGANNPKIHNLVFDTNTPSRLHILGCALKNMVILEEYATAYITLSQEELDLYDHKKGDTEGVVNYGLTLDGIRFAVIFIENKEEGIIKISFRSEGNFSVNEFARKYFNGGGHMNAAGGKSEVSMQETVDRFLKHLDEHKEALSKL